MKHSKLMERAWLGLGAIIWALAAGTLGAQLTLPSATAGAVLAVLVAVFLASRVADSRLRFPMLWMGGLLSAAVVLGFSAWMRGSTLWPTVLGPVLTYTLSEDLRWICLTLLAVLLLRASSLRYRAFLVLEVAAVASILAAVFAGHREGFINRPFFLVDPIWAKGFDPLPVFLGIGAVVAALVLVLVATQRAERRNFLDLLLLLLLIVGIFVLLPTRKLKDIPQIREQLEGKPTKKEGKPPPGKGKPDHNQGGQGQPSPSPKPSGPNDGDLNFQDQQSGSSNPPVAVVLLRSDTDPASEFYYFRQRAYSEYNGEKLISDTSGQADRDLPEYFPTGESNIEHAPTVDNTDVEEDTMVALMAAQDRPFALVDPMLIQATDNPDPKRFQRAYQVRSQVLQKSLLQLLPYNTSVPPPPDWHPPLALDADKQHYLDAPNDPRYKDLLEKTILAKVRPDMKSHPVAIAAAIKLWLEKNGTYSLTSKWTDSEDPVSDFLFKDRTGDCVFFSHAAVYLLRTAGIPARVASGYAVNARNRAGGSALLIRENDSHAWPEVYLDGIGWVVVDIIPERSVVPAEDPPDHDQQQMLGDMARKDNPTSKTQSHRDLQDMLRNLLLWLLHAAWPATLLFLMAMYVWKVARRLHPYVCDRRELPIVAYRAALDELADVGWVRPFGQTREGFAETHAAQCPRLGDMTGLHLRATLGERTTEVQRATVLQWYRQIGSDSRRSVRWYRTLWGAINPIGWWWVK